jgi:hypothetical protein
LAGACFSALKYFFFLYPADEVRPSSFRRRVFPENAYHLKAVFAFSVGKLLLLSLGLESCS